jgi:hypothetical protein
MAATELLVVTTGYREEEDDGGDDSWHGSYCNFTLSIDGTQHRQIRFGQQHKVYGPSNWHGDIRNAQNCPLYSRITSNDMTLTTGHSITVELSNGQQRAITSFMVFAR